MKLRDYLLSDKSDRILLLVVVVLVNLVSLGWYARIDLTAGDTYSLSSFSRRTVAALEEPLTVSIFFSSDLPAPYNGVARYLKDLMEEYGAAGNENFRYRFVDMESDEGRETAESYGIYSVQVQEVRSDEFQSRNVFMGLAVSYGSAIEQLPELTGTDGLEYRITTTISRMVGTVAAAASLDREVEARLYYSPALAEFNIAGFGELERSVAEAVGAVNAVNNDIIALETRTVRDSDEAIALSEEFGFQRIGYTPAGGGEEREATLGIVLRLDERSRTLPIDLSRQIFGGYSLSGLSNLEARLTDALDGLLNQNPPVGYLVGHGERSLDDAQTGAASFRDLNRDLYEFRQVDLADEEIPLGITTLVINGPRTRLDDEELYRIDQFLLRGGSLLLFLDPYHVIQPQQQNPQGPAAPVYLPIESGLGTLLSEYGIVAERNYLLDRESYSTQAQFGPVQLFHIPVLKKERLDQRHPVTRNLGQVVLLSSGVVEPAADPPPGVELTVLAESSPEAWTMTGEIDLNPMSIAPPPPDDLESHPLIVLAEGEFESAFDAPPAEAALEGGLEGSRHIGSSLRPGRILVAGTSELTGPQLIDPEGRSPNAILVHNMVDYLNGNDELPLMRSKGLNLNPLGETAVEYRNFVKGFAMAGMPLLVLLAGLFVWRLRESRRRRIRLLYGREVHE